MIALLLSVAWAHKWEGAPTDVVAKRVVPGTPEQIHARLTTHEAWAALIPESCASQWEFTSSRARVRWTIGPLRRRLTVVVTQDKPGLLLELEHEGKKGWFTQVRYGPAPEGHTEVTLSTPLEAPPWPVRGVFHQSVRPAWEACYAQTLSALVD